jgi:hypothetical protein
VVARVGDLRQKRLKKDAVLERKRLKELEEEKAAEKERKAAEKEKRRLDFLKNQVT